MEFERLTEIANHNTKLNFGKVFSVQDVRQFLEEAKLTVTFSDYKTVYGAITVTQDNELGFILDPKYTRKAFRTMHAILATIEGYLWCAIQPNNISLIRQLQKSGFVVKESDDQAVILERNHVPS